jgi:1-deoxy-D-xylulose-5-phosphate synthase
VALQRLPVAFCLDRAGLCGADGAVHHGFMDIACMRTLPGMVLMAPADATELGLSLDLALSLDGPCAIRYPRDGAPLSLAPATATPYRLGRACRLRDGPDGTFLALGAMVEHALAAAELLSSRHGLETGVVSARFAKPLDERLIGELVASGRGVVVVEDHAANGGFGSAVLELAAARDLPAGQFELKGLPDRFIPHASRTEQLAQAGLNAPALAEAMVRRLQRLGASHPAGK